jgi:hypothetical protein
MKRFLTVLLVSLISLGGVAYACKPKDVDVCPNMEQVQSVVPEGYHLDDNKECVPDEVVVPPVVTPVETPAPVTPVVTQAEIEAAPPITWGK